MKVQVLFSSKKITTSKILAEKVARLMKCKVDQIPPAYPCENEKILYLGYDVKGAKIDKKFAAFIGTLTPARARNVALFGVSSSGSESMAPVIDMLKAQGMNVIEDTFQVKGKVGFGKGSVDEAAAEKVIAWAEKIAAREDLK